MNKFYISLFFASTFFSAKAQVVTISDVNFKARLIASSVSNSTAKDLNGNALKIDANNDGEVQLDEALQVSFLEVDTANIISLEGIASFTNLRYLHCAVNQITNLNLTSLSNLRELYCGENSLTNLNVSGLINLSLILCENNDLSELDLNGLTNLYRVYCGYNQFTTFTAANLPALQLFWCDNNQITSLNLSNLPSLEGFNADDNLLTSLDLSNFSTIRDFSVANNRLGSMNINGLNRLELINCSNNLFTTLDFTGFQQLGELYCNNNQLTSLFIKGTEVANYLQCGNNPGLRYICTNDDFIPYIQEIVSSYGYTNCQVNSYCSFNPEGVYYTLSGSSKVDANLNGCDTADLIYPYLNLAISDENTSGNIIADQSGNYFAFLGPSTYTVTPVIENPSYFTISPASFEVALPGQQSPMTQNFCITPNGSHQDVEIWIVPLTPARPGFDSRYKIQYKNKGNIAVSGSLTFGFNDDYMDFISATLVPNSQTFSLLSWNYANLAPFETREIEVTLNLNSPQENLPVNIGDIIKFEATIFPLSGDESTTDNSNFLRQNVVGSLDPNDKTCVEGAIVGPEMIGEYVHYMIRFENTGTFAAENIVVKDLIDTAKFDIATLVPLNSNFPFETKISNTNQLEFIFENINLPFDDAHNDGYVLFKIKTKPTLVVGDSFSNTANIYFDYNFPITTNPATTRIETLGTEDFEFGNYFSLYPNPASNFLNLETKAEIGVKSISIYNMLGQLVMAVTNAGTIKTIDASHLKSGTYFVKVNTDKGSASAKFIKK